ncbi:MAG: ABC transporter permease [Bacteroidota bacterium]|nr:ABC transporter permease [Bacteroidota bacterium]
MLRNFFKIAVRNVSRNKVFTLINIIGMAVGLAASLLILLWVQDELSYEKFNRHAKNIYRVEEDQFYSGERYHVTVTPFPSGPVWNEKIPEIVQQARVYPWLPRLLFRNGDKVYFEYPVIAADSSFLKMFDFALLRGDPATALNSPHSIILTEELARKYYGSENPIGKTITLENKLTFTVTGTMRELPRNTMFRFKAIIPFSFLKEAGAYYDGWDSNSIFTFVQLEEGADPKPVNKKLTDVVIEHVPQITTKYLLFPLLDIHLHQQFGFKETNGPVKAVYIFTLIAVFVLAIACINFINLSTAKASARGKEIGIKKTAGAGQFSMVIQFLLESLLMVMIAMVIAIVLVGLFLNVFNNVSGKEFNINDLFHPKFVAGFIVTGILAGFISGIYPAFYMSAIQPVAVLKGVSGSGRGNGRLRQILVVIQFTLSILIGIAAVFMYKQLKYMIDKDLGYDKNNLITIQMTGNMKSKYYSLKKELQKETLIQSVTGSTWTPVMIGSNSGGARWEGKDPDRNVLIGTNRVDYDYLKTMKMELVSGRDFSPDFPSDMARDTTGNFLVNEEVVKAMGIGDPVGKAFRFMGLNGRIVGVMKNFHFKGADQPIEPVAFALSDTNSLNQLLIRLTPGNIPASLKSVEKVWKEVVPDYPLDYTFIDQDYKNLFRSQLRLAGLLKYFTILAVIIACLGLYGLASYSAQRRTNEIGIRKVMGADSLMIMYSVSKDFLVLVVISIIIAVPLGWIIVKNLLEQFPYRIYINAVVFIMIAAGAILIALLTVSYQAFRATRVNPAIALKVE